MSSSQALSSRLSSRTLVTLPIFEVLLNRVIDDLTKRERMMRHRAMIVLDGYLRVLAMGAAARPAKHTPSSGSYVDTEREALTVRSGPGRTTFSRVLPA